MRTNIQLPSFHGFYESIWSSLADDNLEYDLMGRGITRLDDWSCKWSEFEMEVVNEYTDIYLELVNRELGMNVKKLAEPELSDRNKDALKNSGVEIHTPEQADAVLGVMKFMNLMDKIEE